MKIGKVPNDILKKIVIDKIKHSRSEIILRPKIGEDCTAVDFGDYACVLSSDPITGAVNEIGRLAVYVSCNDVAACGVEPIGLLVTILAPPDSSVEDLETIMTQLIDTADLLNVDIMGGHTEITASVTRFVVVTTAVGKVLKGKLITSSGAKEGDSIILSKTAGMEGTAIIAHDKEEELVKVLGREFVENAKAFINNVSAVKEGVIAGNFGANAMHDVTEGGVLGAIWEVAEASEKGVVLYKDKIPVAFETEEICKFYSINPLRLISSGCMIITSNNGKELIKELESNGVSASIIGEIIREPKKIMYDNNDIIQISQPEADELFKVVGAHM
jgi:hydrogenase expression/formation protein HypE